MVILNNHIGKADWCCDGYDGQGLWYSDAYPPSVFFATWQTMARRYGETIPNSSCGALIREPQYVQSPKIDPK